MPLWHHFRAFSILCSFSVDFIEAWITNCLNQRLGGLGKVCAEKAEKH